VVVPLGARQAKGIALEPRTRLAPGVKVREISRLLDAEPLLSPELLTLGLWIAEYYLAPVGEVFRAMLPLKPETRRVRTLALTKAGRNKLAELESSLLGEAREGDEAALLRSSPARTVRAARLLTKALAGNLPARRSFWPQQSPKDWSK